MDLAIFGGAPVSKKQLFCGPTIGDEEIIAVIKVMKSGALSHFRSGRFVKWFEYDFSRYLNIDYAVSTTSGTTALHTAICALDICPEDEILVPALTFVSSASVILQERARPVFVDIDKETFNIDAKDLERKITKKTKAIIVVHLYGSPAKITDIVKIARKYKLKIIEDCAQAHGAKYRNKYIGTFGDIGCFSFQQTKNMTCGEGGMIVCRNKELFKRCSSIVDHGLIDGYLHGYNYDRLGYNYQMTELQAAIGIVQLKKLRKMNIQRINNASLYKRKLQGLELCFQKELNNSRGVYNCLTALLPKKYNNKRDWFVEAVRAENVEILKLYPLALTQTKLFAKSNKGDNCPNAVMVTSRLFNLFTNPGISREYITKTCTAIKKVMNYMDN